MCTSNDIHKSINTAISKYKNRCGSIYYGENELLKLKYEDIQRIADIIYENLKYLVIKSTCFGLLMDHNIYIPSFIYCLQKLGCSFIFLDAGQAEIEMLISKLGIKYVISYNTVYNNSFNILCSITLDIENICDIYSFISESPFSGNINYIVLTSGTTDNQKIVKVEHHCIQSNVICLRKRLGITEEDVIFFGTNLTFDPSIIELYLALTTGACLFMVSKKLRQNPNLLFEILFQKKTVELTFLQMCPSVFTQWSLLDIEHIFQNSHLKVILLGGEKFPLNLKMLRKSEQLRIFNIYGITELSCWAMISEITDEEDISLGEVLDDTILKIKDENGQEIIEGEGELFIGSSKRICYVNDEQPEISGRPVMRATGDIVKIKNNKIFYIGRSNDIIKRYGLRVNLLYIENVILSSMGLKSVPIWVEDKRKFVLFVAINEKRENVVERIVDKLRIKLIHILPKECIPDYIELLPSFPLTKNGKIDKHTLLNKAHEMLSIKQSIISPKTDLINLFNDMWYKYLCIKDQDLIKTKNFYELGGTSILRIQFMEELKQNYSDMLPADFFNYVFNNSYDDVEKFLNDFQINRNKRKLNKESGIHKKIFKKNHPVMKIKWTKDLQACVDSTPTIIEGKSLIAIGSFSNIFAILHTKTGSDILKIILPNAIESSCLVSVCENFVYIGCYDSNMYCINLSTAKIVWGFKTGDRIKNKACFIAENSAIVFGSYDKYLYSVDAKTGSEVWKVYVNAAVTADPLPLNNRVIVATIKGCCMCLSELGEIIWQIELDYPVFGSPTVLKNGFVVSDVLGTLYCLGFNGEKISTYKVNGNIYSSILFHENYVIFGTDDASIYCLTYSDDAEPQVKHKLSIDSGTTSTLSLLTHNEEKYVVAASKSGYVYLISFTDFNIKSEIKLDGEIFSSPVVFENNIFIGCRDNNLVCIEIT